MTQQPVISVRGEACIEADPEIAVISAAVQVHDRDRRTALDRLADGNARVLSLTREYGEAVEKLESGAASAYPDLKDKGRTAGYVARTSVRATIREFAVLGELVSRLAGSDLVAVTGPWWSLRPDSPVYRQARIDAAHDAMRRAREYAEAFNGQLGPLIEVADAGLLAGTGEQAAVFRGRGAAGLRGGAAAGDPPGLDFEPVRQPATAHIDARFYALLKEPGR